MKRFELVNPKSVAEAVTLLGAQNARALAGGTDLLGLMKDGIVEAERVVNLKSIPDLAYVREAGGELRIGALTHLSEIAASGVVQQKAAALAQAAGLVASPQIRNTGTLGGNLAQKVRCWYYRDADRSDCYKRDGSYCYAPFGANDLHAIFDAAACFAVHPSDTAVALSALDARVVVAGPNGQRTVPIGEFFTGPEVRYTQETILQPDEIIVEVQVPSSSLAQPSLFLKAAPRRSIDFARGSVAVSLAKNGGSAKGVRIALGAVAPTPRRATAAEQFLEGKGLQADNIARAADLAVEGAQPLAFNASKVDLARGLVRQALTGLAA